MGSYSYAASALFLIVILLLATANQLANGQQGNLLPANVSGQLCCTSTGTCPGPAALPGVLVSLFCDVLGSDVTAGQATTGNFQMYIPLFMDTILGFSMCRVIVPYPSRTAGCPALATGPAGLLESPIQFVGVRLSGVFGLVRNYALTGFIRVPLSAPA
ncbi:hypothetical protein BUALT_Bualt12G0045000 [Buddleja alternifolia]|uniref:Hydrophobin n=1 Tax=Buddleja alternifolia TaxID=168488 RepID=A0AAV6WNV1_9LAMI|nr:hypothetical protein BUALT_Bualt12G0045000 [Buddleja alternifolia]